jgi:ligand-binding SRPBCC domain-containing protein
MNPAPKTREYRVLIPTSIEALWAFHAQPNAFKKLTPPPVFIQVLRNSLT